MRSTFVGVVVGALTIAGAKATKPSDLERYRSAEVQRLRAHFDSVDSELRSRDGSSLTPSQLTQRKTLIAWLRDYRDAGIFPINDRFPGRMVPFFRDSRGTLCAMAYLIDRSGRGDIVDRIAHARNNAFIPELANDPELGAWLKSSGLDVSEAARIQPTYGGLSSDPDKVSSNFAIASLVVGGGSLAAATLNLVSPSGGSEFAGILVGIGALVHGIDHLDQNRGTKRVANASIITGSVSLAASVGAFLLSQARKPANRVSSDGNRRAARLMIAPAIIPAATQYRLGLAGSATF